jgi:DNA-directed RNA polymerase subunit beta'
MTGKNVRISLLSKEKMLWLSRGEVSHGGTFHQNGLPEKNGLFCQKIFGSYVSGYCLCGKYHSEYRKKTSSAILV